MLKEKVTIINPTGLHARPAAEFVKECTKFKSKILIKKAVDGSPEVNAKSMIMLLSQAFSKGTEVELICDGEDEVECIKSLVNLINSGFGE